MEKMTMEEFRKKVGSECNIDNCETCREHAKLEHNIEIVEE
jgi:hypothetical protein